jgi:hypothetical protein
LRYKSFKKSILNKRMDLLAVNLRKRMFIKIIKIGGCCNDEYKIESGGLLAIVHNIKSMAEVI